MSDQRWIGHYLIATDTFKVSHTRVPVLKGVIEFSADEQKLIDAASEGRTEFEWSPDHSKLTEKSRAWWAMM